MRLHELAKEIGVSSKELLKLSKEIGLQVKSHSSNVVAGEESILRVAMKMEMEEKVAEEAAAKAKEEKAAKKKTKKKAKKKAKKKKVITREGEKEEEEKKEDVKEKEAATGTATDTKDASTGTVTEGEIKEKVDEAGEEAAVKEAPTVEEGKAAKPAAKRKGKIKQPPPKRAGATILGRITLPSREEMSRKVDRRETQLGAPDSGKTDEKPEDALTTPGGSDTRHRAAGDVATKGSVDSSEKDADKKRRTIKPKQMISPLDADDDPLLQGIRIKHWNKHRRPRKPRFRHGSKGRKRGKKIEPIVHKKVDLVLPVTVKELSNLLGIKVQQILVFMMKQGSMVHINSLVEEVDVLKIAEDFGREIGIQQEMDVEKNLLDDLGESSISSQVEGSEGGEFRAPIVAFLGHVDHGKTSLLDAIRETNVVDTEDGGITQHVSAYKVETSSGHSVAFLDTPGHKAFTEMRARGAKTTDIVVLVVAADDGVMPQTEEAVQHARAADVPIVVAINKVDKANANVMQVKQQLAGLDLVPEDWGGEVGCVEVSALKKEGLDKLLERLVLEAEIQELRCNPDLNARGVVLDARKDGEIGNVITVLVQEGTLRLRDDLIAGDTLCRVRALYNDQGRAIQEAGPATPVNVIGFDSLPEAGDEFMKVDDSTKARDLVQIRLDKHKAARMAPADRYAITLENLFESIEAGKIKEIRVVLKTDVKGTLEVLRRSLEDMQHEEVKIKLLRSGLGDVTEDDVLLALASDAVILGFHVETDEKAYRSANENGVDIRIYKVIYKLLDDVRAAMEGELEPARSEKINAHLDVREVFKSSRIGTIAGCYVTDGVIHRNDHVRVIREDDVVYEGELSSLKRFKDDQREIKEGFECGVKIAGFDDIKEKDVLEAFEIVEEKRHL